ncbi:UDP-3-O-[3-hydroxymyristoyl] N-acetylglucosamine deacetylase [Candidatus Kinetoplastibacterium desouzaii TCC079E]|uniref:UDP-3-O-acyl-N-acetylglucosamine deacetylase n=1 Tax=Candidatus Kinetoplastidibacterium desouzai TCC079E TaxID=1208919 RepID=M1LN20_9PROT|nr:UDP-3-O-acyl-N-acetylglucosamine deacetylase [Candidatus Kinetoplastibacterium desouzaii]AGF47117.1 UDP-3-O-[3-hydroxymyristoyl] N-acetylglucosamine deacetylase [Candidatus Kinetoplastibacterium desouzaii TCC079E]
MLKQRSIKKSVSATGIGLHSGKKVNITFRPAEVNNGIIFHRVDCIPIMDLPAYASYVVDTRFATVLQNNSIRVSTVEHVMSALYGLGIDNIHIDLNGEEVPIMDGSAAVFICLLKSAGIVEQNQSKKFIKILKSIEVGEGYGINRKYARLEPCSSFIVNFSIAFDHPVIRSTSDYIEIDLFQKSYIHDISRARTFGFMQEVENLRSIGLVKGASLDNVIVMDDSKILNIEGLRYEDEFVRHKALDAIGDLYLLGGPLLARYVAHKSGHSLNNKLIMSLLDSKDSWEVISYEE